MRRNSWKRGNNQNVPSRKFPCDQQLLSLQTKNHYIPGQIEVGKSHAQAYPDKIPKHYVLRKNLTSFQAEGINFPIKEKKMLLALNFSSVTLESGRQSANIERKKFNLRIFNQSRYHGIFWRQVRYLRLVTGKEDMQELKEYIMLPMYPTYGKYLRKDSNQIKK